MLIFTAKNAKGAKTFKGFLAQPPVGGEHFDRLSTGLAGFAVQMYGSEKRKKDVALFLDAQTQDL